MKTILSFFILSVMCFPVFGQQAYHLEIDPYQETNNGLVVGNQLMTVSNQNAVVILGGQHNVEGLSRYLVYNGGRLSIDSMSTGLDGKHYVLLRREDGRDFYDLYPTLRARLTPVIGSENIDESLNDH